jgi:hypothetical protein
MVMVLVVSTVSTCFLPLYHHLLVAAGVRGRITMSRLSQSQKQPSIFGLETLIFGLETLIFSLETLIFGLETLIFGLETLIISLELAPSPL